MPDDPTGSFIWYELMTPDPDAAARFYGAVVGWTIGPPDPRAVGRDYRMIGRGDGGQAGGVFALTAQMQADGARAGWLGYLQVADVDATLAAIQADGGTAHMPATDIAVGRIALVSDPQGALLYLMTPTPPAGDATAISDVFSTDRPEHVRWNELTAPDDRAALASYARHFGWTEAGVMPMGPAGDYTFVAANGVTIGATMRGSSATAASWRYYIGVADIDAAVRAVKANGGTVIDGPHEIPGGEFSLHGRDPQGADFGLVGPRKG